MLDKRLKDMNSVSEENRSHTRKAVVNTRRSEANSGTIGPTAFSVMATISAIVAKLKPKRRVRRKRSIPQSEEEVGEGPTDHPGWGIPRSAERHTPNPLEGALTQAGAQYHLLTLCGKHYQTSSVY